MTKSLILRASAAAAFALSLATPASAAIVFDPIPFDIPGNLGQQVHSSGTQSATTVFGFLSPGTPLGVTISSLSNLDTNGSGHAVIDGPGATGFDDLAIFFTNGERFNAIEFNIAAFGQGNSSANGKVSYFLSGNNTNVADGFFNFTAGNGNNNIRIYGDNNELFRRLEFDATAGTYASIRQIDFGGVVAVPEPATWAMMLTGFGVAGLAIRRRRKTVTNALA